MMKNKILSVLSILGILVGSFTITLLWESKIQTFREYRSDVIEKEFYKLSAVENDVRDYCEENDLLFIVDRGKVGIEHNMFCCPYQRDDVNSYRECEYPNQYIMEAFPKYNLKNVLTFKQGEEND